MLPTGAGGPAPAGRSARNTLKAAKGVRTPSNPTLAATSFSILRSAREVFGDVVNRSGWWTGNEEIGRVTLGFLTLIVVPATRVPLDRADYPRVVLLGLIWMVVPSLLFPIAQQHIDSALAGMLNAAVPIFSTLVAMVLLRSLPRFRQAAGVALGFAGTASACPRRWDPLPPPGGFCSWWWPPSATESP